MIDIRYFLDRQNAGREEVPEPPMEPTPSQPQTPARHTTVVKADGRTVLDLMGPKIEPLTSVDEESYCVMKGTIAPGVSIPLHSHGDPESFYVLSGEAQFLLQGKDGLNWQTLRPGDFVQIPGDTKHAWRNVSDHPMEALITTTQRLGSALREMGEPAQGYDRRPPTQEDIDRVAEINARYGYWVGSPEENSALGISLV
jgi:quercetin dioxygenase-like cupin family protein